MQTALRGMLYRLRFIFWAAIDGAHLRWLKMNRGQHNKTDSNTDAMPYLPYLTMQPITAPTTTEAIAAWMICIFAIALCGIPLICSCARIVRTWIRRWAEQRQLEDEIGERMRDMVAAGL